MAPPETEIVEVTLLSGRSDRPSLTFTPGTPSPTVSLGTAGQWAIASEGVAPVHVFLTFDGQSVHVAAAVPNLPAAMAGASIGTEWTKAPIPCELRFGGACVILRRTSKPGAFTQEEATMHDGGALLLAAQRAAQSAGAPIPPTAPRIPSMRPAAGMPASQAAESTGHSPESSPTTIHHPTGELPPDDLDKTKIAPHPPRPLPPAMTAFLAGQLPPPAESSGPVRGGAPPAVIHTEQLLSYWQAASPVKKATLVLMPLVLVASYILFQDEPAPAPSVATRHAAPDAAVATIVIETPVAADASVAVEARVAPASTPVAVAVAGGKRSPERAALDTVAAGSFDEAAKQYEALAAAHTEDPSYKEAARILHEKAGN